MPQISIRQYPAKCDIIFIKGKHSIYRMLHSGIGTFANSSAKCFIIAFPAILCLNGETNLDILHIKQVSGGITVHNLSKVLIFYLSNAVLVSYIISDFDYERQIVSTDRIIIVF